MIREVKHQMMIMEWRTKQLMKPKINIVSRFDIPANHLSLHPYAEQACERAGKELKDIQTNIHLYFLQHFK